MSGDEAPTGFAVDTTHAGRIASAFRTWAGSDDDLLAFFTPDVLIGISVEGRRGYLYDDGWTIEAWIERGVEEFRSLLVAEMGGQPFKQEIPDDQRDRSGLLELAIAKGNPFIEVRHLI